MTKCKNHKLIFIPKKNGDGKAEDIFCGQTKYGETWYCSEECMGDLKLVYEPPDNDVISND